MDDLVGLLRESTTPMILHASRSDDHGHTDVV
jgi:hypothetical protein